MSVLMLREVERKLIFWSDGIVAYFSQRAWGGCWLVAHGRHCPQRKPSILMPLDAMCLQDGTRSLDGGCRLRPPCTVANENVLVRLDKGGHHPDEFLAESRCPCELLSGVFVRSSSCHALENGTQGPNGSSDSHCYPSGFPLAANSLLSSL